MKKEVITIRREIDAGQRIKVRERIKADATIEEIRIKFYPGEELTLHVRPTISKTLGRSVDILTYPVGTDNFISGDDDYFIYPVIMPVEIDDFLEIIVENVGPLTSKISVDVVVDYYGGQSRVTEGVIING